MCFVAREKVGLFHIFYVCQTIDLDRIYSATYIRLNFSFSTNLLHIELFKSEKTDGLLNSIKIFESACSCSR